MNYDTFIFYNEFDIAELRIKELWDVVDNFVIVEMPITFSGRDKPLLFAQNFERFRPYRDKIIYVPVLSGWPEVQSDPSNPVGFGPWARESYQRNKQDSFQFCDSDIVTVSDCDEIPHPSVYSRFNPESGVANLEMLFFHYWIDVVVNYPTRIYKTGKICTGRALRKLCPEGIRNAHQDIPIDSISNAGWHFSYLGDVEFIRNKLLNFSHCEDKGAKDMAADPDVNRSRDFQRKIVKVPIDGTWPKTILNNMDYWKKYLCDR